MRVLTPRIRREIRKGILKVLRAWAWWIPQVLLAVLVVIVGGYTASKSPAFLSEFNLNSLLLATLRWRWWRWVRSMP
ncbi:MAG: hypothetical protein U0703_14970 [Anaerolineae bacterium]